MVILAKKNKESDKNKIEGVSDAAPIMPILPIAGGDAAPTPVLKDEKSPKKIDIKKPDVPEPPSEDDVNSVLDKIKKQEEEKKAAQKKSEILQKESELVSDAASTEKKTEEVSENEPPRKPKGLFQRPKKAKKSKKNSDTKKNVAEEKNVVTSKDYIPAPNEKDDIEAPKDGVITSKDYIPQLKDDVEVTSKDYVPQPKEEVKSSEVSEEAVDELSSESQTPQPKEESYLVTPEDYIPQPKEEIASSIIADEDVDGTPPTEEDGELSDKIKKQHRGVKKIADSMLSASKNSVSKMPLGERLIAKGLISRDQLETSLKEQRNNPSSKKMLGAIMIDMGFITESALGEVLTESSGVKAFDIRKSVLDPNLIKRVPRDVATRHKAVPVSMDDETVRVAITDIYNILAIDQIRRHFPNNMKVIPVYAPESDLTEIIDQYYGYETSIGGILKEIETGVTAKKELSGETDGYINPTVRLVDAILVDAIKRGASDIHFEPESNFVRLRYRMDGKLVQVRSFHADYWAAVVVRVKIMSGMNIAETRNPQDGRTSYFVLGREIDFRVATHPTIFGENIVMRILDKQKALMPLENLGFTHENDQLLRKLLKRPEGIIIVTGPTGSGKTTTLYSVLNFINSVDINIMTLENPVEYQLPMIRQSDVRDDKGMDFVMGIKSLMRQDPDVIFVGEVRDEATANMAMRAAMTGHRVFTTLHTNDAVGAIPRLIDIGIPPHLLAGSLICIVAQRLLRKLCSECKEKSVATDEEAKILGVDPAKKVEIYHHQSCDVCYGTGYKGRVATQEIFPIDKGLDELISTGATRKTMVAHGLEKGFIPMVQDGINKVLAGVTDIDELIRTVDMTDRI